MGQARKRRRRGACGQALCLRSSVNGNLRTIAYRGIEVLWAVSWQVRDKDWGTHAPRLSNLQIMEDGGRFEISFDALCKGPDNSILSLHAATTGEERSLIFDGAALPRANKLSV